MRMPIRMPHALKRVTLVSLLIGALSPTAQADDVVKIVVPYTAGGGVDIVTRIVEPKVAESLGKTIIIDNRPGASTNIGSEMVAHAEPDGQTLLTASNTLASNGALFSKMPFDPATDLVPVGQIGYAPLVVVVNADSPYKTLDDLIKDAKADPEKVTYGSAGNGSSGHLASELLKHEGQFDALHIPYKGGSAAVNDLLGNRITFMSINPIEVISYLESGKLRALAMLDDKPNKLLPDVPLITDLGLPNATATVWWGLAGPKGLPEDQAKKINDALQKSLADAEVEKKLSDRGVTVVRGTTQAFASFVGKERDKWTSVIKDAHIQAD